MTKFLTTVFYGSIGFVASIALFLIFYWSLSLNSSIYSLINNTKSEQVYLWSYTILTFGTIILFGINASLFAYRWRKFGPPRLKIQGGSGLGALVGVAASACPVCDSILLSAIGIAGGLAVFPFQGLELKALSFGLMALPVWLTTRELKTLNCGDETCPSPRPTSFRAKDKPYLIAFLASIVILMFVGWNMLKSDPIVFSNDNKLNKLYNASTTPQANNPLYRPILLTRENATIYVNLLWPLGLSNYMSTNKDSPVNGKSLFNFASTGSWNIGKEENGGAYFNKFRIVELTPEQEVLVTQIAKIPNLIPQTKGGAGCGV